MECCYFPPQIEQLQATLQTISEQKSQLEGDLQQNMEMVRMKLFFVKLMSLECK